MKKVELILGGLNCANCANKIDSKLKTMEGIEKGSLNFYNKKAVFYVKDDSDANLKIREVIDMINSTESGLDIKILDEKSVEDNEFTGDEISLDDIFEKEVAGSCRCTASCVHSHEHREECCTGHDHGHESGCSTDHHMEKSTLNSEKDRNRNRKKSGLNIDKNLGKLLSAFVFYFAAIAVDKLTGNFPVYIVLMAVAYIISAKDVIIKAFKNLKNGTVFDENFLMLVATVGAVSIGEYPEAVGVMLFYGVGEYLESRAVDKSRRSIESLMNIKPEVAHIVRGNRVVSVRPETVNIGDLIIVKVGEKVPIDGVIVKGESRFDTSAITGESVLRTARTGEEVNSGIINKNSVVEIEVTRKFSDSTVSRILDMVENAVIKKSKTENFITVFARYYTPAVVISAIFLTVIPTVFFAQNFDTWFYRSLIFLVVSCPCALVLSIPLGYFSGIGVASRNGILVKGSNYLEAAKNMNTVVFDKTGTLTKGVFRVTNVNTAEGVSEEQIVRYANIAESRSTHPIAASIVEYASLKGFENTDNSLMTGYEEIASSGVRTVYDGKEILVGNFRLMERYGIEYVPVLNSSTKVYVACDGKFMGSIEISDEIKENTKEAIQSLKRAGVKNIVMLTGDSESVAKDFSEKLGITEYHADLLPDEKVSILEDIMKRNSEGKTAFAGDGINDAPAIARADIGISMGGVGSDAAIEASDMVIMTDEISKISGAIRISRRTSRIVWQNIVFAIGVKIMIMILSVFGLADMWMAIFGDVGVAVLSVLNSIRVMNYREEKEDDGYSGSIIKAEESAE